MSVELAVSEGLSPSASKNGARPAAFCKRELYVGSAAPRRRSIHLRLTFVEFSFRRRPHSVLAGTEKVSIA